MNATHETYVFPTRAAADRAYRANRAELIAELGWAVEGVGRDAYLASSVELTRWVNEQRAAKGQAPRVDRSFTDRMNGQKVKALTIYRYRTEGGALVSM
jgi:hypothetical protein